MVGLLFCCCNTISLESLTCLDVFTALFMLNVSSKHWTQCLKEGVLIVVSADKTRIFLHSFSFSDVKIAQLFIHLMDFEQLHSRGIAKLNLFNFGTFIINTFGTDCEPVICSHECRECLIFSITAGTEQ